MFIIAKRVTNKNENFSRELTETFTLAMCASIYTYKYMDALKDCLISNIFYRKTHLICILYYSIEEACMLYMHMQEQFFLKVYTVQIVLSMSKSCSSFLYQKLLK